MTKPNIEQIKEALDGATDGPWSYRPQRFDDWGYVRAPDQGDGWMPFICQAKAYTSEEFENECRRTRQDPWGANARLIAMAPDLARMVLDMAAERDALQVKLDVAVARPKETNQ